MKNVIRFALVLFLVNLIAAFILAGVYNVTKPRIEREKRLVEERALKEVMPGSIGNRLKEVKENGKIKYWEVFKGSSSRVKGYIFIAKKYGYSSVIETMVGVNATGEITGVTVLSQNETPGLGAKIVEIVSDKTIASAISSIFSKEKKSEKKISPYFTEQFKGKSIKNIDISNIDSITGATISSKAVVDSIRSDGLEILNAK